MFFYGKQGLKLWNEATLSQDGSLLHSDRDQSLFAGVQKSILFMFNLPIAKSSIFKVLLCMFKIIGLTCKILQQVRSVCVIETHLKPKHRLVSYRNPAGT